MDIVQLKEKILTNTLDDSPLIFKYSDNKYLCYEYINAIVKNKNARKVMIESLANLGDNEALFDSEEKEVFILDVEEFKENLTFDMKNIIVVCQKVNSNVKIDYIDFPKILGWQIEDYIKARLSGLDDLKIKWLCDITNYDIYRLNQECKKLELFPKQMQETVFNEINADDGYSDLTPLTIFSFTNAILKKDLNSLKIILSDLKTIDVEGTGVVTILLRQFKNLIDVQINPRNTATSLHMTDKQFKAISYNAGKFTNNQLIEIYQFLTSIDYRIKQGELTFYDNATHLTNNNALVDYLTINLLKLCQ